MVEFPFQLLIKDSSSDKREESLTCLSLLRVIPGRRCVYDALWNDREVIVKVFLDKISAGRHLKREWRGLNLLQERGLSAPGPLFFGKTENGGLAMVIEKIADSSTAIEVFNETTDLSGKLNLLGLVCKELASQHSKGVMQKDLQLGNFLLQGEKLFSIDTAQMCFLSGKVNKTEVISQLASLASIIPAENVEEISSLCEQYAAAGGLRFTPAEWEEFWKKLAAVRKQGIKKSLKKCLRTNKRHVKTVKCDQHSVAGRDFFEKVNFAEFVQNVDELMRDGEILKDGNTCFVSRISLAAKDVVVKRYNFKGIIHSVRHTLKRSRARRNWLHAHRLGMLDIPTAKPLAFIEKRRGLMIYKSYFVTEYIDSQKLSDFLQDDSLSEEQRSSMIKKVTELLDKLSKHRITHGDLKQSNILIVDNEPILIDLDSMMVHRFDWMFNIKRKKDLTCIENRIGGGVGDSNR